MRSYEVARSLASFLEFVFWSLAALGAMAALIGGDMASNSFGGRALIGALPGVAVMLIGLIGVAMTQNARAGVDSAEYSQQMLKVARDQLEVSRQALQNGTAPQASYAQTKSTEKTSPPITASKIEATKQSDTEPDHWDYGRTRIHKTGHGYLVEGSVFLSLEDAKKHVDGQQRPPASKSSS